jgi:xylulokinase
MAAGAGPEVASQPPVARTIEPERALIDALDDGHARYQTVRDGIAALAL